VTHDALDALALGDELVVLENGTVVQRGTPAEVAQLPATDYVARLMGLNLVRGEIFAPTTVGVTRSPDATSRWQGTVTSIEQHLSLVRVSVLTTEKTILADIPASAIAQLQLAPGHQVWLSLRPMTQ
jgi:molybdate transport system ATP-binding protein